jgi:hypothetical protein
MRTTLFFKKADIAFQWAALITPVIICFVEHSCSYLMLCYFTVGSVQFVSCAVNKITLDTDYKAAGRKYYEFCLSGILVLVVLYFLQIPLAEQLVGCCLLSGTPLMAVWYASFTITEMNMVKRTVNRRQYM